MKYIKYVSDRLVKISIVILLFIAIYSWIIIAQIVVDEIKEYGLKGMIGNIWEGESKVDSGMTNLDDTTTKEIK